MDQSQLDTETKQALSSSLSSASAPAASSYHFDGFSSEVTLEEIRQAQSQFARERDWDQYHTPRNLLLALTGEVGELSEIFQWKGEVACGLSEFSEEEKIHVGEEMSDVLLYLIRMADRCGINLPHACMLKIEKNASKYPASQVYGSSRKYTDYENGQQKKPRTS